MENRHSVAAGGGVHTSDQYWKVDENGEVKGTGTPDLSPGFGDLGNERTSAIDAAVSDIMNGKGDSAAAPEEAPSDPNADDEHESPDEIHVVKHADGTETHQTRGEETTYYADGTVEVDYADGSLVTINPDGSMQIIHADGTIEDHPPPVAGGEAEDSVGIPAGEYETAKPPGWIEVDLSSGLRGQGPAWGTGDTDPVEHEYVGGDPIVAAPDARQIGHDLFGQPGWEPDSVPSGPPSDEGTWNGDAGAIDFGEDGEAPAGPQRDDDPMDSGQPHGTLAPPSHEEESLRGGGGVLPAGGRVHRAGRRGRHRRSHLRLTGAIVRPRRASPRRFVA